MPKNAPVTADSLLATYAARIASITGEPTATTLPDLADQLRTAADRIDRAGINGSDELEDAAVYLSDVATHSSRQQALLDTAAEHLEAVPDIVHEYQLC